MKSGLIAFFWIALALFGMGGGIGYTFYHGLPQFGTALTAITIVLILAFFRVIELPTKDNFKN